MKTKGRNALEIDRFKRYFAPTLFVLRLMGMKLSASEESKPRMGVGFCKKWCLFNILTGCVISYWDVSWIAGLWYTDRLMMILAISALSHNIVITYKGSALLFANDEIQALIQEMARLWQRYQPSSDCREKIIKSADNVYFLCRVFISVTFSILFIWGVPPFYNMWLQYLARDSTNHTYDYSTRILVGDYPFEIDTAVKYMLVIFEELMFVYFCILYWSGCDTLFAQLTSHIGYQFEILKYDMERLINEETDELCLKKNLVDFASRHNNLLRLCDMVQDIFGSIIFVMMFASSMSICFNVNALKKLISSAEYVTALIYSILLSLLIIQIFIYCMFAESLTNQTGSIADAVYNSKWTEKNYYFKVYFQMFILKSQHPFYCTGFGFFRIGHVQLAKIMNGALSYYMFIEATS